MTPCVTGEPARSCSQNMETCHCSNQTTRSYRMRTRNEMIGANDGTERLHQALVDLMVLNGRSSRLPKQTVQVRQDIQPRVNFSELYGAQAQQWTPPPPAPPPSHPTPYIPGLTQALLIPQYFLSQPPPSAAAAIPTHPWIDRFTLPPPPPPRSYTTLRGAAFRDKLRPGSMLHASFPV